MTEKQIVDLFWNRDEDAIAATDGAYGRKLRGLSGRILRNPEDSEEVVNDTYLKTWNSIPKARPQYFYAYIAAICLVTAREAGSKDVQRVELPFTLTEAPADAEGESLYHPLNPSEIPGMTVGDLHVTKTPLGLNLRMRETVTDQDAYYDIMKYEIDGLTLGEYEAILEEDGNYYFTANMCQGTLRDIFVIHVYDCNKDPLGEIEFRKFIGE